MAKNHGYNIIGQRFGKLVVLKKGIKKSPGKTTWTCICDCGNKKDIRGDALKSGSTKSCGRCKINQQVNENLFILESISIDDILKNIQKSGENFGEYIAKEYIYRKTGRNKNYENFKGSDRKINK